MFICVNRSFWAAECGKSQMCLQETCRAAKGRLRREYNKAGITHIALSFFSEIFLFYHSDLRQAVQGGAFPKRRHRLCRREYPYPPHRQNSLPLCPRQCRKFLRFQQRSDNTVYCFSITRIFAFCAKAIVFRVPLVFALTKAITTLFSNPFI